MRSLTTARELLAGHVEHLPATRMGLAEAVGCRLAESVRADCDLPATDVSTMDGYAARAEELALGAPMPVAFEVPAGGTPPPLPPGVAARIFTGAVVPENADTVVPQEQADVQADGTVRFAAFKAGAFIRRRAELYASGATLAAESDLITPQRAALLASAGADRVLVIPRPRVALLSTGSELVPIGQRPGPGRVRDCNGVMLAALARRANFEVVFADVVADEVGALRDALGKAAADADLIVTCGGVSVGDYDLVPKALGDLGAETVFHKVSIKPGKPVLTARLGSTWVVGLPGNPVSALVGWRLFARPLAETLAGDAHALEESPQPAVLTGPAGNTGDRTVLAFARLELGRPVPQVTILDGKGSHDVVTLARANALAVLEIGAKLAAGDMVGCYRLG